jgi:hypothetical protein
MDEDDEGIVLQNPQREVFHAKYRQETLEQTECARSYRMYAQCLLDEPLEKKCADFREQYGYACQAYEAMKQTGEERFYGRLSTMERHRYWLAFLAHLRAEASKERQSAARSAFLECMEPCKKGGGETGRHFVVRLYHSHQFDAALLLCQLPDVLIDAPHKSYRVCARQLDSLYSCYGVMECRFYPQST